MDICGHRFFSKDERVMNHKRNLEWKIALFLLFIFNILSYITMNLKLPYGCTMDFRYIVSTLFVGALFVGIQLENIERNDKKFANFLYNSIFLLTFILMLCSNTILLN